jgi:NTP pyrophosphatase (non-canonical NTP hydrolase)
LDQEHGVRYFNELTNMAQLTEEVGEVARIIMVIRKVIK